jgi:hypothetical protein
VAIEGYYVKSVGWFLPYWYLRVFFFRRMMASRLVDKNRYPLQEQMPAVAAPSASGAAWQDIDLPICSQ